MAYSIDTRSLQPGDIFIPVKGPNFDGHNFIEEAKRKGAAEILDVDLGEFAKAHRAKYKIPVIAITGSAGKTTTKDMLAAVLSQKFKVIKSAENQNNEIGVPLTLLKITPETEIAIIEMAMRGLGQIEYLTQLAEPTHGLITNIGVAHIELLKTREAIALAKSEIMRRGMKIFLNNKDEYFSFLREQATAKGAIVQEFTYDYITQANIAAVTSMAKEFDLDDDDIKAGLAAYEGSAHRQKFIQKDGITIIDDTYNSNPDALIYALRVLKEKAKGRTIAVLGDMKELGSKEVSMHRSIPVKGIDMVFTYGELAAKIKNTKAFTVDQKDSLIATIKMLSKPGDTILVKGSRSMKMEEIVEKL